MEAYRLALQDIAFFFPFYSETRIGDCLVSKLVSLVLTQIVDSPN